MRVEGADEQAVVRRVSRLCLDARVRLASSARRKRGTAGIEPATSSTQTRNHATRPSPLSDASIAPFDWANPEVIGSFHGENLERGSAREFKKYNTRKTSRNTIRAKRAEVFRRCASDVLRHESRPRNARSILSKFFGTCQLDSCVASRLFFRQRTRSRGNTHAPRMPEASRAGARRHKRARSNTHRLARGGRVSVPRARVSSVATDARTARGRCATIARGVGHQKRVRVFVCVSNAEASRRDDGRGVTRAVAGR